MECSMAFQPGCIGRLRAELRCTLALLIRRLRAVWQPHRGALGLQVIENGLVAGLMLPATCCALMRLAVQHLPIHHHCLLLKPLQGDVLKNLTAGFVATMVPPALASAIVYGVALSCESSGQHCVL